MWSQQKGQLASDIYSLWDALSLLVSHSRIILDLPLTDVALSHPSVFFVYVNPQDSLYRALNYTTTSYEARAVAHALVIKMWALTLTIVSLVVLALVMCIVVRPTVYEVESNKEEVLLLFTDIPEVLVQRFERKCDQRLLQLRNTAEEESDPTDEELSDNEDDIEPESRTEQLPPAEPAAAGPAELPLSRSFGVPAVLSRLVTRRSPRDAPVPIPSTPALPSLQEDAPLLDPEAAQGNPVQPNPSPGNLTSHHSHARQSSQDMDIRAVILADQRRKASKKESHDRKRKDGRSKKREDGFQLNAMRKTKHITMLKVFGYMVVAVVYFTMSYYTEFGQHERILTSSPSQLQWSSDRRVFIRQTFFQLRQYLAQDYLIQSSGIPPTSIPVRTNISDVWKFIVMLNTIQKSIAFGDDSRNIDAPSDPWQIQQLFKDACVFPTTPFPYDDCSTFDNGILSRGLHASILEYAQVSRTCLNTIQSLIDDSHSNVSYRSINVTLRSAPMQVLLKMNNDYLRIPLLESTTRYSVYIDNLIASLFSMRVGLLIGFIAFTLVLFILFYNPLVYDLNVQTKRTNSLLLLIPPEVMEHLDKIRGFVEKLAASNEI
eukprot:TRINITY_DN3840_c0_g3_i1.p1 TRINITY_DN3840_c0_g3~~TRINITY_DN3840_c0_g3_i1.p1  ORF type:complete len:602 (+),score=148.47 TRINITY_DN3840_c0_g3_i1:155-1960(+)